jgi:hypothetical protein
VLWGFLISTKNKKQIYPPIMTTLAGYAGMTLLFDIASLLMRASELYTASADAAPDNLPRTDAERRQWAAAQFCEHPRRAVGPFRQDPCFWAKLDVAGGHLCVCDYLDPDLVQAARATRALCTAMIAACDGGEFAPCTEQCVRSIALAMAPHCP